MNTLAPALVDADAPWAGLELIARGATRVVAVDPDDARHCLKFQLPADQRTRTGPRERMRRAAAALWPRFDDNATELEAYRRLHAVHGEALHAHVARVEGLVDTPWGRALRSWRVLDADGTPSHSLHALLHASPQSAPAPLPDAAHGAIDAFAAWLIARGIPLFDLNAGNLMLVREADAMRIVCIDCKSTRAGKELVPVSRVMPALRRRKILRRIERLKRHLQRSVRP